MRTAHRIAMKWDRIGNERASGGSSRQADGSGNLIWTANATLKVKHNTWRMGKDALPTCVNLVKRGLDMDPCCPRCGEAYKDVTHLVLNCLISSTVWKLSPFRIDVSLREEKNAVD